MFSKFQRTEAGKRSRYTILGHLVKCGRTEKQYHLHFTNESAPGEITQCFKDHTASKSLSRSSTRYYYVGYLFGPRCIPRTNWFLTDPRSGPRNSETEELWHCLTIGAWKQWWAVPILWNHNDLNYHLCWLGVKGLLKASLWDRKWLLHLIW